MALLAVSLSVRMAKAFKSKDETRPSSPTFPRNLNNRYHQFLKLHENLFGIKIKFKIISRFQFIFNKTRKHFNKNNS